MIKVGFPRGLYYYDYYPLWKSYFNSLNIEVVSSTKTNKDILNLGIENCVDEACLPIKIFHGHVKYLEDKVDYIFIPKYVSLHKREYNCPKHLGIAHMVYHSIDNLPSLITPKIVLKNKEDFKDAIYSVGRVFTKNKKILDKAYEKALESYEDQLNWIKREITPFMMNNDLESEKIRILILGHPYNIYDDFVNMGILKKLNDQDIEIITSEDVDEKEYREYSDNLRKRIFWTQGRKIIGSVYALIEKKKIDGIIYLSAFGCGLDSVLMHMVEQKSNKHNVPVMTMTFDEQTGEAGFNTRFEAFIDMMKWRSKVEDNISTPR
ncbi:acyl-CoA dehydratase activase-related protein [Tissierella sp. Yu-01]|uniref:acyl-CoA dehydratase activase-related protein n=1 Tax=Tissierella sp. Yu-01 TaxID=3035694 RepID=UPI00240E64E2|nr:acyl-CoA dehydratase activase-related protein [Tissierella sp. Yu-01]WFA09444.1 acyl-CoA dehydratase activase-related protein [Tissierella sp. Yu-01]